MESGLEGRNNAVAKEFGAELEVVVSMESGLEGRNNQGCVQLVKGFLQRSQWSPA